MCTLLKEPCSTIDLADFNYKVKLCIKRWDDSIEILEDTIYIHTSDILPKLTSTILVNLVNAAKFLTINKCIHGFKEFMEALVHIRKVY